MSHVHRLLFCVLASLSLGVTALHAQRERIPPGDLEIVEKRWPNAKRTYTSLRYVVLKEGDQKSAMPEPGMMIKALYKGMLLNGKVFDEAKDPKEALVIRLGRGNLIAGWDEALQKMHKGERWLLIVPPELAYGSRGRPPAIPRDATLVFELELLDFYRD